MEKRSRGKSSAPEPLGQALLQPDEHHGHDHGSAAITPYSDQEQVPPEQGQHRQIDHRNQVSSGGIGADGEQPAGAAVAVAAVSAAAAITARGAKNTSVEKILDTISEGSTIRATGADWKLTRAVVHLEDAWKGRISPCPPLEKKEPTARALFKMRWKFRSLDFLIVHLLLLLSLVETPGWCVTNGRCFWSCFPDFTRNYHMSRVTSLLIEGPLLLLLAAIAMVDVHACGLAYWSAARKNEYQSMWFKHGTILGYAILYLLSVVVDIRAHDVCGYFRVLLYLSVHRRTVLVVTQLRHILGAVAEIWFVIFFNILLFAWMGVILFSGTEEGDDKFPDVFEAGWRLFVLFTTTNFPEVMMTALDQVRATVIYFAGFVILNVFFLAPLSLAFIFNVFRGGQSGIPQMEEEIRLASTSAAFNLLDDRGTGQISSANMGAFLLEVYSLRGLGFHELARLQDLMEEAAARTPEEPNPSLSLSDFKDAVSVMDRSLQHAEWITEVQWYYPHVYQSPGFRRLTTLVKHKRVTLWPGATGYPRISIRLMDLVDTCFLFVSFITLMLARSYASLADEENPGGYDWVQICVVCGFFVTVCLRAVVRGWHNCLQRPMWMLNAVITFSSVLVVIMAFCVPRYEWGFRIMRALRVAHMALLLAFIPRLGFLIRTLLIMTKRAATPTSVLLAWAFFMALLGTQIFGGKVCVPALANGDESCIDVTVASNTYTEAGLELLNFNDVATSMVTLLVLFVVNDWYVIVDEFVDVTGTGWARAFFIVNYIIGVAVILNLVVTVVINSFWDEYKNTNKPALARRQLHAAAAASARHRPAARRPSLYMSASVGDSGGAAAGGAAGDGESGVAAGVGHEDPVRKGSSAGFAGGGGGGGGDGDGAAEGGTVVGDEIFGVSRGVERVSERRSGVDDADGGRGAEEDGGGATGERSAGHPPLQHLLEGGGGGGGGGEFYPPPPLEGETPGWGWLGVSTTDEEYGAKGEGEDAFSPTGLSRRGSRDSGRGSRLHSGQQQQQQQALPSGEETDMDAERRISRKASMKRFDVSGIT